MGWGNCGLDGKGRPIGYMHEATCDHPGCNEKIDRGLGYVCGEMHGEDEVSCEGYFCSEHRSDHVDHCGTVVSICSSCAGQLIESGDWRYDSSEGMIVEAHKEYGDA